MPRRERVSKVEQHARVTLHRAADVTQQYERTRAHPPFPRRQHHDVAAAAKAFADRAPQIDARAAASHPSPRTADAGVPYETAERHPRVCNLLRRKRSEILV